MERRNFIKNAAALAVLSQIDITNAIGSIHEKNISNQVAFLTLQSVNETIKINILELSLTINPPPDKQNLCICAELNEKQKVFINDAQISQDKTQFTFEIGSTYLKGKGLIWDYEYDLKTNECSILLRITENII